MNFLKVLNYGALRVSSLPQKPCINNTIKRFRKPSICNMYLSPVKKPCFDLNKMSWEMGRASHARLIRSFLYSQYWPREPSIVGLWMSLDSPYLETLTDKYSYSGDRFLAFERMERTREKKLVGVLVANKCWPWAIDELEEWAHYTHSKPDRNRMYFCAHCLKSPGLFKKYNVPYIYDVEILGTAAEVTGQGVATQLLRNALHNAEELRHPLVQVVSLSQYTSKVCERCGMKCEWTMDYRQFVDGAGQRVFFPRRPHHTVAVYVKYFDLKKPTVPPCKPPF